MSQDELAERYVEQLKRLDDQGAAAIIIYMLRKLGRDDLVDEWIASTVS